MGIQGLLPYLKKASRQANIREFKGCTVAIDSYCWLHRGAFACAEKLAVGEKTDQYVFYCMKYVNHMLSVGVKPVMVFDGCHLPSKKDVETSRRERREVFRKKAAQLLREGRRGEARDCLTKCIDITPHMALELMNACRQKGVDCIVAPYEADAQLAYLNKIGVAQVIITEDSDLILFGCEKVMFKMDNLGNGVLVESHHLNIAMGLAPENYTFDKFRHMCILSGCDYLPSLPGIGLGKATKVFKMSRQKDITTILKKLPSILKMANLTVSSEYIEGFYKADNTFLYQLVYNPLKRELVPLNPYPPEVDPQDLTYAGPYMDPAKAFQIALGNVDIHTGRQIGDYNPDTYKPKSHCWKEGARSHELSIWNKNYRPLSKMSSHEPIKVNHQSTKGQELTVSVPRAIKKISVKRQHLDEEAEEDLLSVYQDPELSCQSKKHKMLIDPSDILPIPGLDSKRLKSDPNSPELSRTVQTRNENQLDSKRKSPLKSPVKNVFAINNKSVKKERFSLTTCKKQEVVTEVKSRFFKKREPLLPNNFFDELNSSDHVEKCSDSLNDHCQPEIEVCSAKLTENCMMNLSTLQDNTKLELHCSGPKSVVPQIESHFSKKLRNGSSIKNGSKPVGHCTEITDSGSSSPERILVESGLDSSGSSQQSSASTLNSNTQSSLSVTDSQSSSSNYFVASGSSGLENSLPKMCSKKLNKLSKFYRRSAVDERMTSVDDSVPVGSITDVESLNQNSSEASLTGLVKSGARASGLSRYTKKQTQEMKEKSKSKKQPSISNFFNKFAFEKR